MGIRPGPKGMMKVEIADEEERRGGGERGSHTSSVLSKSSSLTDFTKAEEKAAMSYINSFSSLELDK